MQDVLLTLMVLLMWMGLIGVSFLAWWLYFKINVQIEKHGNND